MSKQDLVNWLLLLYNLWISARLTELWGEFHEFKIKAELDKIGDDDEQTRN